MASLNISCPENINTEQPVVYFQFNLKLNPYRLGWNTASLAATNFNANYVGAGNFPNFLYTNNLSGNFEVNDYIYDTNCNGVVGLLAKQGDINLSSGSPITQIWYYAPYKTPVGTNSPLGVAFTISERLYLGGNVVRYKINQVQAILAPYLAWFGNVEVTGNEGNICNVVGYPFYYTTRLAYIQGFTGKTLYTNSNLTQVVSGAYSYFALVPNSGAGVGGYYFVNEYRNIWNLSNGTIGSPTGNTCSW